MFLHRVLFSAASHGDVDVLSQARTEDLHVFDPVTGDTLVHIAVQKNHAEAVDVVARRAPDVLWQRNAVGRTPLLEAVAYGYIDIAKKLVEIGPSAMFVRDFYGHSPLVSKAFLDAIPDELWSYATPSTGNSLMHESAINNLPEVAERAVRKAPEMIRAPMIDGMMPMHVAAFLGRVEIAKIFLREFPDCVSYATSAGKTPLFCATELSPWKSDEIIRVLFEADPSMVMVRDGRGRTPIFEVARLGTADVMRLVLQHHPDAALIPEKESGWTPLHASLYGRYGVWTGVAKEILNACPLSLYVKDKRGLTALQHAYMTFDKREEDCGDFLSHVLVHTNLSDVMWDYIPNPCKHISRALGPALTRSPEEAARVVRHMTPADRARLHVALYVVSKGLSAAYSEDVLHRIVGLALSE